MFSTIPGPSAINYNYSCFHIGAYVAFKDSCWIIDSKASTHMLGHRDLFIDLSCLSDARSISVADGRLCSIAGEGVVHVSSYLPLDKVLYILDFSVNLLSISAITKTLFCSMTFFSISQLCEPHTFFPYH